MKKFVIIDGNAIIHRAYHALPPLTNKEGLVLNAVYGFTSMLLKVMNDLKPDCLGVSFDVGGGTFRDKLYDGYKAKRVKAEQELYDQIPYCYEVVKAFNIPIYTKQGYEADDVIGTMTKKLETGNWKLEIVIVSGDMDLLQLVDEHTKVFAMRKGMSDVVMYDVNAVREKYGFEAKYVVDFKALRGDASDNIPGVPGIGEKTATELIQKFGSIEDIYKNISKLEDQKIKRSVIDKLVSGEKSAQMSHELAKIVTDIPDLDVKLDECEVKEFDREKIIELFQKFEFTSLLKRLPTSPKRLSTEALEHVNEATKKTKRSADQKIKVIEVEESNVKALINKIEKAGVFVCKEVISGTDILNSELLHLLIKVENDYYKILNKDLSRIKQIFENDKLTMVGHDLKQLLKATLQLKIENCKLKIFDVMIASYLLNSSTRAHDLKSIVLRELGKEITSEQTSLFGSENDSHLEELAYIEQCYEKQKQALKDTENLGLFEKIEMKLIPVLAEMELNGVAVDTKILKQLSDEIADSIKDLTDKIWKEAGEEFNIASSVQLRDILFDKLGLSTDTIKKGKTGFSTAESELEKLQNLHPIIPLILDFRELAKLQNTYVDVLPTLINKKTGRIHTSFNQAITTTGRLSSSDPNLQNIPIRTELGRKIRESFIAEEGNVLIVADYSQIELRIVASMAQDKKMIEIFEKGEDIHKATAAAINGVSLDKVTKEMRYAAKEVNFGVLYGMGAYGLSWRTGIPQWQAQEFIAKYFGEFNGVKKYIEQTLAFAKKEGYVETLFGRRRYIPELKSQNFQLKNAGERMAINMPIQGTAADLMKLAMIEAHDRLKAKSDKLKPKMILQVHDELVLEVKKGTEDEISKIVKESMENVAKLRVPIEVHIETGKKWGDLK